MVWTIWTGLGLWVDGVMMRDWSDWSATMQPVPLLPHQSHLASSHAIDNLKLSAQCSMCLPCHASPLNAILPHPMESLRCMPSLECKFGVIQCAPLSHPHRSLELALCRSNQLCGLTLHRTEYTLDFVSIRLPRRQLVSRDNGVEDLLKHLSTLLAFPGSCYSRQGAHLVHH